MKTAYYLIALLGLAACGKSSNTVYMPTQSTAPAASDVQRLIDEENEYRLGLGQSALSSGLSCTVQQISSGNWLSSASPGYPGSGVLVLTGASYAYTLSSELNQPATSGTDSLLPSAIRPLFLGKNYKRVCTGHVVLTQDGYYSFDLNSDDGSILTVDGVQVVNNDGQHGMTLKSGVKYLRRGVRSFSLQYAQSGGGALGLILKVDGSILPAANFLH